MRTRRCTPVLMLALAVASACGRAAAPPAPDLGTLPASFRGELPCADCPGLIYALDLRPDGEFILRTTYRERPPVPDTSGRWSLISDGAVLALDVGAGRAEQFAIGDGQLTKLDIAGRPIESTLNYTLTRTSSYTSIEPAALTGGTWRLFRIAGEPVTRPPDARQATLRFQEPDGTVTGSTGCNNLSGSYKRANASFTFGPAATTKMFCPDAAELETAVLSAMTRTSSHRTIGNVLELRDETGNTLASYVAE